jgi:hypothetical protein
MILRAKFSEYQRAKVIQVADLQNDIIQKEIALVTWL